MKKIKTLISIISLFLIVLLTGCGITTGMLTSPVIELSNQTITWDAVSDAEKYYIYVNGKEITSTEALSYTFNYTEGNYSITVKAYAEGSYSKSSNTVYLNLSAVNLNPPVIRLDKNKVVWDKVLYADGYLVYNFGEYVCHISENEYLLTSEMKQYKITIKATCTINNELVVSDFSNEVTYENIVQTNEKKVMIFSINDTHGAFESDEQTNGIAKVASVLKELEDKNTIIKIANGDIFQGGYVSNMTFGKCFIDVLSYLNFDCFVIGNHEFDWGLEKIATYKDGDETNGEAAFPFIAANIIDKRTSTRPTWLDEYTIVEKNGQKVGIIGLIGQKLTSSILAANVLNYEFTDPLPIIKRLVPKLRSEGCDFVVIATHEYDREVNNQISYLNQEYLPDAIICAHTHQKIAEFLPTQINYELPILQSNTKNITVGSVVLSKNSGSLKPAEIKHYYPAYYNDDAKTLDIIQKYQALIDEGNEVVGFTPEALNRNTLGVFACDGIKNGTGADLAIMNTAGVRTTISTGEITVKEIYEVFPFDNYVYLVDIKGDKLKSLINRQGSYLYWNTDFNPDSISNSKTYKLAVIDYVYFGSYYDSYFEPRNGVSTGEVIRKFVIDEMKKTLS